MKSITQPRTIPFVFLIILQLTFLFSGYVNCFGYNVKDLEATYSNGQVFLTWTNPDEKNVKYNVYRSATKFTS